MGTKVNKKHYDSSLEYNITMYDNLPYIRDDRFCGADKIAIYSGNVVKYFSCISEGLCIINNQDK